MKIQLYSVDDLVRLNKLEEVTNPILYDIGANPTEDGLLSRQIFGNSQIERKETFAYIDLHGHFLNPFIYKMLKRMNRNFESVVNGSKKFSIAKGELIVDEEKGDTGLEWLYKHWDELKFEKNESIARNERIDVLRAYDKNVLFQTKLVVCPPFYRDTNMTDAESGKIRPHLLNKYYSNIISFSKTIENASTFDIVLNNSRANIELQMVEIYNYYKGLIEKKNGLIRKNLLGKSITYGSRSVITAPTFKSNTPEEMPVDYTHTGIPLSQACALLAPFIVAHVKRFFQTELEKIGSKYPVMEKDGSISYVKLKKPDTYFNDAFIKKHLDRFMHSPDERFEKIELPVEKPDDKKGKIYMHFIGRYYEKGKPETESPLIERPATWTDVFYQAAYEESKNKIVWVTRYPLLDYFGMFPTYMHILSTNETVPMYVGNVVYKHYPKIDLDLPKEAVSTIFADTTLISNLYLHGNGGDYDGKLDCRR